MILMISKTKCVKIYSCGDVHCPAGQNSGRVIDLSGLSILISYNYRFMVHLKIVRKMDHRAQETKLYNSNTDMST